MKTSLRLILIAVILASALVISAYAMTLLFTQTFPSKPVKPPNSGAATANCATLTLTPDIQYSAVAQESWMNATCAGGPVFTVNTSGVLLFQTDNANPVYPGSATGYSAIYLLNYTIWKNSACRNMDAQINKNQQLVLPTNAAAPIDLSAGDYVYCLHYSLSAYSPGAPSSLPEFHISWSSP